MDNETEVIRQQMEESRASLQDKLEVLEQQVLNTVQDANQTVETVKETVEAVKDTVQETVASVKDSVQESVASVKETFNFERHMQEHPWVMLAGAAAVGFIGERLLQRLAVPPHRPMMQQPTAYYASSTASPASAGYRQPRPETRTENGSPRQPATPAPSFLSKIAAHYSDEINKLKSLAISAVGGAARDYITQAVGPSLAGRVKEVVDGLTVKMGGKPLQEPVLHHTPGRADMHEATVS